ncbi:MAG: hypothetical protein DRP67_00510 [Candidatus Omnitrophota bacterium]|nr:MAG: hypothetical protein DRP67_00510 [Candidatus Omnitrophota bacterium]HDN97860.1 hypothetical protein [bacterium]
MKIIDVHVHLTRDSSSQLEVALEYAEKYDVLLCPNIATGKTMDEIRKNNYALYQLMKKYPKRILGVAHTEPLAGKEGVDEFRRCILDYGMIGLKLTASVVCSHPSVFKLAEEAIKLKVFILQHSGHATVGMRENESDTSDIVKLATRYPELMIIMAHIAGGQDWEWTLKMIKPYPNIYVDTSGSQGDMGVIEESVKYIGSKRLVFGSDGSNCNSLGRVYGADISEKEREDILVGNMKRYLKSIGREV